MKLAKIMSSTWYEVGREVGMKLVMMMAKISATRFLSRPLLSSGKIKSGPWYEVAQEVGMKLVMNIVKISGSRLFMAMDDLYDDGYRFSLSSER